MLLSPPTLATLPPVRKRSQRHFSYLSNTFTESVMRCGRKIIRLIFNRQTFLFFSNINVIPFKIVPLGSYTPMETFPLLLAALEVFNRYGLQHIRYTLSNVFLSPEITFLEDIFKFRKHEKVTGAEVR